MGTFLVNSSLERHPQMGAIGITLNCIWPRVVGPVGFPSMG